MRVVFIPFIQNKTMLLGVDSLDATRGLVQKFLAVEEMFEMQPGLADKVNFVQVRPPRQTDHHWVGVTVWYFK